MDLWTDELSKRVAVEKVLDKLFPETYMTEGSNLSGFKKMFF